jgi:hypothetical protein
MAATGNTNQKKILPVAAIFVNGLELNEQSLYRTFHGCFLPNFDSFSQAVTEVSSRSVIKHGRHRQFLFLIG